MTLAPSVRAYFRVRPRGFVDGIRLFAAFVTSALLKAATPARFRSVGLAVYGSRNLHVAVDGIEFEVRPRTNDLDLISPKHEPLTTDWFRVGANDIVVDVGAPLLPREKLSSAPVISNQMLAILIQRSSREQLAKLAPDDIVIRPALGDASSFDFGIVARVIGVGEAAARGAHDRLAALALGPQDMQRYVERHPEITHLIPYLLERGDPAGREGDSAALDRFDHAGHAARTRSLRVPQHHDCRR